MKYLKYILPVAVMCLLASCAKKVAMFNKFGNTVRVMSYNIHHCNPPSKPNFIDVEAIAAAIARQNPDVVALQEVDVNTNRSGKVDEAALLAQKLKMNVFFAKAINHDGGEYGVAILSKFPISDKHILRLTTKPDTKGELRVLATVLITLPNGDKVRFGCTHLDAQRADTNRLLQVKELVHAGKTEKRPFILAGDWNSKPGSETVNIMDKQFTRSCQECAFTIPVINPKSAIDFVAYSKSSRFDVVSYQVISETYASDHLPVVAVLKINSGKKQ